MICYQCNKFLRKGHSKNIRFHPNPGDIRRVGIRGEYRYYCNFCLKVEGYWEKMNTAKWRYTIADANYNMLSGWVLVIFSLLFYFFWNKSKLIIFIIFLIILPICLVIDYQNYSKNKKKNAEIAQKRAELWEQYENFKRKQWRPLADERELLRRAELYVKSKYRYSNEEFCRCEKCLLKEYWKK